MVFKLLLFLSNSILTQNSDVSLNKIRKQTVQKIHKLLKQNLSAMSVEEKNSEEDNN